jgi:hypothetical protein
MTGHQAKVTYKFEPEGDEKPGAIHSFQLVREVDHQTRRHERERWQSDMSQHKREVVADGITRTQMAALIADAADWLSYVEGETR